jgi:hypothetical protein
MNFNPDLSVLVSENAIRGEDEHETAALRLMLGEAKDFVSNFKWCGGVHDSYMGIGVGGVVAVFLLHINPVQPDVDDWVWVIVGDLPAAYITIDNARNAACALNAYIAEMRVWVSAVRSGQLTEDIIPVDAPPTMENACQLEGRLDFLRDRILIYFKDEL